MSRLWELLTTKDVEGLRRSTERHVHAFVVVGREALIKRPPLCSINPCLNLHGAGTLYPYASQLRLSWKSSVNTLSIYNPNQAAYKCFFNTHYIHMELGTCQCHWRRSTGAFESWFDAHARSRRAMVMKSLFYDRRCTANGHKPLLEGVFSIYLMFLCISSFPFLFFSLLFLRSLCIPAFLAFSHNLSLNFSHFRWFSLLNRIFSTHFGLTTQFRSMERMKYITYSEEICSRTGSSLLYLFQAIT